MSSSEGAGGRGPATDLPIVDAHHHFWELGAGHYPWLQEEYDEDWFLGDHRSLQQDFLPEQYARAVAGHDVVATVHVEAERARDEQVAETRFLEDLSTSSGLPSAIVAHVVLERADRDDVLAAHAESRLVRGVRCKPVTAPRPGERVDGPGTMSDPAWLAGLDALGAHGFSWDLRVPFWHLHEAADVVAQRPGVPVVLEHCGLPLERTPDALARWEDGLVALADSDHVVVKVSELGLRGGRWDRASNADVVRRVVSVFDWDRVLFGSNLPVSALSASFGEIVATVLGALPGAAPAQLRALFADNARRVYRVDP